MSEDNSTGTAEQTALEVQKREIARKAMQLMRADQNGIVFGNYDEMWRFAHAVANSGLAPKGIDKPESILVAMQLGMEIGLKPMGALQNIAVINGRPGIYGDAALGLVRASGLLEDYEEWYEVAGKELKTSRGDPRTPTAKEVQDETCACFVRSMRKGQKRAIVTSFSIGDAKLANLFGKAGPWTQYPARMLKFRARGFNLRDNFSDVLKGLKTTEELEDYQVGPLGVTGETSDALPPNGKVQLGQNKKGSNGGSGGAIAGSAAPSAPPGEHGATDRAGGEASGAEAPLSSAPVTPVPGQPMSDGGHADGAGPEALQPGELSEEDMRRDEAIIEIRRQLAAAKWVTEIGSIQASVEQRAAWLGPIADTLRKEASARYYQLTSGAGATGAGRKPRRAGDA